MDSHVTFIGRISRPSSEAIKSKHGYYHAFTVGVGRLRRSTVHVSCIRHTEKLEDAEKVIRLMRKGDRVYCRGFLSPLHRGGIGVTVERLILLDNAETLEKFDWEEEQEKEEEV